MILLRWLFGCIHRNTSRVWTLDGRSYVVCLECGKEIEYSWSEMKEIA